MAELPLLITPAQLDAVRRQSDILILDLCQPDNYQRNHIPGAVYVSPAETQYGHPPAIGLLPTMDQLTRLVGRTGLKKNHQVVVYDDEGGGWAGRMCWLLNSIGFKKVSLLSGGLLAWHQQSLPLTAEVARPANADYVIDLDPGTSIDIDELIPLVNAGAISIWDARSEEEYLGRRQTALRNGHMPGASHYDWTRAMDLDDCLQIRDLEIIRGELCEAGIDGSKEVVTHCQSHHRSGLTYVLGKLLGFNIRAYAGSWSEWGNRSDTPIV